jgi:hypothetical protein
MFQYGIHYNFLSMLFFLLGAHAYFDFAGQGEFMAQAKDQTTPQGANGVWKWALFHHSVIHGAAVAFFSHSMILGVLEVICHASIDYWKTRKALSFSQDQILHIGLKVVWAFLATAGFA